MDLIYKIRDKGLWALIFLGITYVLVAPGPDLPEKPVKPEPEPAREEKEVQKIAITMQKITKPIEKKMKIAKKPPPTKPMQYNPKVSLVDKGKKLIGDKGQRIGSFPDIIVNYKRHLGTAGYLSVMDELGGRFYVLDQSNGRIMARINPKTEQIESKGLFRGLSPRSRQVNQEPLMDKYIRKTIEKYGQGNYSVIVLVPLRIDQYLIGVISDAVQDSGKTVKEFSSFYGFYSKKGSRMFLWINEARLKSGAKVPFNLSVRIS